MHHPSWATVHFECQSVDLGVRGDAACMITGTQMLAGYIFIAEVMSNHCTFSQNFLSFYTEHTAMSDILFIGILNAPRNSILSYDMDTLSRIQITEVRFFAYVVFLWSDLKHRKKRVLT